VEAASPMLGSVVSDLAGLLAQLLTQFVKSGRQDVLNLLNSYLLTTVDTTRPGNHPLTSNPTLASLNHDLCLAGDALLALLVVILAVRAMLDHSLVSQYDLRTALPRVLAVVVLMNLSLPLIQAAIDLNNALSDFASGLGGGSTPWSGPLATSALQSSSLASDLFQVLVLLVLVVVVAVLGFAYVIRMAVLQVLIVTAPFAALALILPDTRRLARAWGRLLSVALFMQAAQILVLSIATATGLAAGSGLAADIYALAAIWVTLKVPSFLAQALASGGPLDALTQGLVLQARRIPVPSPARGL
jgi:hypothetical protein